MPRRSVQRLSTLRFAIDGGNVMIYPFLPLASLALGDLTTARRQADDVVALAKGISLVAALTCRARVEIAPGRPGKRQL